MTESNSMNRMIQLIAEQSIDRASQSLSKMLKAGAAIELKRINMVDVAEISETISRENEEVIGSLVNLVGDAPFKFLFYVPTQGAYTLTDMMMRKPPGTSKRLDVYVSSTVQEIGNILASAVANVFASNFQISLLPSPPIVFNDFAATLFQEFILESAAEDNRIMLMESRFEVVKMQLPCHIFVIPMPGSYKILEFTGGKL